MTYNNKFVMCVLVDGQVQEELANGMVKIPFGSEYSLRFRNKNDRNAAVKFFIDNEPVSGKGYLVRKNDYIDVKRHFNQDKAFKFVELNSPEAVDAGKNGANHDKTKGLIEARFYLEKERKNEIIYRIQNKDYQKSEPYNYSSGGPGGQSASSSRSRDVRRTRGGPCGQSMSSSPYEGTLNDEFITSFNGESLQKSNNSIVHNSELKDGCTVEGIRTGQSFTIINMDLEEEYTTLKLFLQGYDASTKIIEVIGENKTISELAAENEKLKSELDKLKSKPKSKRSIKKK